MVPEFQIAATFAFKTGESETTTVNFGTLNTISLASISGSGATSANITSVSVSTIQDCSSRCIG